MTSGGLRILALGVLFGIVAASAGAQQQSGDWWGYGPMGPGHMWSERMPSSGWGNIGPGQRQRMQRHWIFVNEGVPASYRGARSTIRATPEIFVGRPVALFGELRKLSWS